MSKKALRASKTRIKDMKAKTATAYIKPRKYYNNNSSAISEEMMFCESMLAYRSGACVNCGGPDNGAFYCTSCR